MNEYKPIRSTGVFVYELSSGLYAVKSSFNTKSLIKSEKIKEAIPYRFIAGRFSNDYVSNSLMINDIRHLLDDAKENGIDKDNLDRLIRDRFDKEV